MKIHKIVIVAAIFGLVAYLSALSLRPLVCYASAPQADLFAYSVATDTDAEKYADYLIDKQDGYITDLDSYDYATPEEREKTIQKLLYSWIGFGLFFTFAKQIRSSFSYFTKNRKDD